MRKEYIEFITESIVDIITIYCRENDIDKKVSCVYVSDEMKSIVSTKNKIIIFITFNELFRFYDVLLDILIDVKSIERIKLSICPQTIKLINDIYSDYVEKIQYGEFNLDRIESIIFGSPYDNIRKCVVDKTRLNYYHQHYISKVILNNSITPFRKVIYGMRLNLRRFKRLF